MPLLRTRVLLVSLSIALASQPALAQNKDAMDRFIESARKRGSDALYVSVNGKPVIDWAREQRKPVELMSAVKSVVAIGIGKLLADGELKSLDEPVHTFYPEWKQGRKKDITIRHLLNHTSGIQNVPNAGAEIYPSPNSIQLALAAELTSDPGTEFSYNNKAVNLLAGIIERASGLRMDLYFGDKVFPALGINEYQWYFDKSGHPHAMAGLRLTAADAAKFGAIVLSGGMYADKRVIPEAYAKELVAQSQPFYPLCGLLWWRYTPEQTIRLRSTHAEKFAKLASERFSSRREMRAALQRELGSGYEEQLRREHGPNWFNALFDWSIGEISAYYAEGFLGQYIVVVPSAKLVAVRQIASRDGLNEETGYSDFPAEVVRFARELTKVK